MNSSSLRRPDYIIIGAMKSATSSLQEQLAMQPGIFASEPKEPNFFSNDEIYANGHDWYSDLFSSASPSDILGEASTHYTKLPRYPNTVDRLAEYCPDVKLIYVMRHPIDRLISHYVHNWTMGYVGKNVDIEQAIKNYQNFVSYSLYSHQLNPFIDAFGRENILPVFFGHLFKDPQAELSRISKFIGYTGRPIWYEDSGATNLTSERFRKFPLSSVLVESAFSTWLRKAIVPQSVRDAIKSRLKMDAKPVLSGETRLTLEKKFDEDLDRLGSWLGKDLNCKNFKEVTTAESLEWRDF